MLDNSRSLSAEIVSFPRRETFEMKKAIDEVIVFGNSNAYGSELNGRFASLQECIEEARTMHQPHPQSWPSQLNRMGLKTSNVSIPGSGFLSNVTRAIKSFTTKPDALHIIDISLMDHIADKENDYRSRNVILMPPGSIEKNVLSMSPENLLFVFNEVRKMLHQLGMNFKFISPMNPFVDLTKLWVDPERKGYVHFLRNTALLEFPQLDEEILNDFIIKNPYFLDINKDFISDYTHLINVDEVRKVAEVVNRNIREQYDCSAALWEHS